MSIRPQWKGFLKLSLASCPIALYPAVTAAERVSFRQVNRQTGNRLRHQLVDSVTGDVVSAVDKARGYEVGEQKHLIVEDREIETARQEARSTSFGDQPRSEEIRNVESKPASRKRAVEEAPIEREDAPPIQPEPGPVRVENTRTIEIERFVPRSQLDPRYYDTPYYIAPTDEVGQDTFAVIRDAIARKDVVGLARVTLAKRERPIMIVPMRNGLCGITLRYGHEVRDASECFGQIPEIVLPEEMLQVAEHIIETKTGEFELALLQDRYRSVLVSMLKEKQSKQTPVTSVPKKPATSNVLKSHGRAEAQPRSREPDPLCPQRATASYSEAAAAASGHPSLGFDAAEGAKPKSTLNHACPRTETRKRRGSKPAFRFGYPDFLPFLPCDEHRPAAEWTEMDPRNQIRRLPFASPYSRWRGDDLHQERTRLDGAIQVRRGRSTEAQDRARRHRRRDGRHAR
jgi:DNA end-binding protein Ku